MSVGWKPKSLKDRKVSLRAALKRAIKAKDPAIYLASERQDLGLEAEGNRLDGVAIHKPGQIAGTYIYTSADGTRVVIYTRTTSGHVEILRVHHSHSNWKPSAE